MGRPSEEKVEGRALGIKRRQEKEGEEEKEEIKEDKVGEESTEKMEPLHWESEFNWEDIPRYHLTTTGAGLLNGCFPSAHPNPAMPAEKAKGQWGVSTIAETAGIKEWAAPTP